VRIFRKKEKTKFADKRGGGKEYEIESATTPTYSEGRGHKGELKGKDLKDSSSHHESSSKGVEKPKVRDMSQHWKDRGKSERILKKKKKGGSSRTFGTTHNSI